MRIEELKNGIEDFILALKDDELAESSLKVYRSNINKFIEYLESRGLGFIDKSTMIDYRKFMQEKYKISTLNKYIVILNKYCTFLGHEEIKVKQIKSQRKHYLENIPTISDYKRMLRIAKKCDIVAYYFILIASYTGMRVSAIREITVEALKESKKNEDYIKIFSKGKHNEVPFPAWLRRECLKYARDRGLKSGYLFPSPRFQNRPLTRKTLWEKVQKVAGKARVNLDKGHPHAFRHLLGKEITRELGYDDVAVADIMGHESVKTSEIYQQKSKKEIAKIVNDFRFK